MPIHGKKIPPSPRVAVSSSLFQAGGGVVPTSEQPQLSRGAPARSTCLTAEWSRARVWVEAEEWSYARRSNLIWSVRHPPPLVARPTGHQQPVSFSRVFSPSTAHPQ
ncbi:hypothetical protein VPH35_001223 [Triticum aestivum]